MDRLRGEGEVVVWHSLSESILAPHRERWADGVTWRALPPYRETLTERILRQAKVYAQLYWQYDADHSAEVFRLYFRYPSRDWRHRQLTSLSRHLGQLLGHAAGVQWLDRQHARTVARRAAVLQPFLDVLRQEQADVLFCTHQRASRAVPAMLAARQAGIPAVTFIYSWDNLPKGRMAVHADHFLVWSEYMRAEMARYYPEVDARRLHITGTPQFEPYFDPGLIEPREAFLARHGLSPDRPVVCFSGDDRMTSPYDQVYLADLAASLRTVPAERRPQILFRRCPTEPITRFQAALEAFPEIKLSDPLWTSDGSGDWTQTVPTPGDVALLVNLVRHCDAVVNVASTVAMDFAIYDKPAIYVAYTPQPRLPREKWLDVDLYRYPHFRPLHRLCPLYWVREPAAFAPMLDHLLTHREEKQRERQAWVECHAVPPLADASRRCVQALRDIAARPAAAGDPSHA